MKTETKHRPPLNGQARVKHITVKGQRMVMLPENEYDRLLQRADEWEPVLPEANERGNYPALETLAVLLARDIIRARRKLGLSQAELARRAGVRPETLNRIEQGKRSPSVATVEKIDRALQEAEEKGAAKTKTNGKTRRPLFKKGDIVSFLFGSGSATGKIVEDRGGLGIGGRRLYGIRFDLNPGDQSYIEVPEEDLTAGAAVG